MKRGEVLVAGAGTGKTFALVTRVLARLEGVDPNGPIAPDSGEAVSAAPGQLVVLTFTNKAARELEGRIRGRARALAAPTTQDRHSEASTSCHSPVVGSCRAIQPRSLAHPMTSPRRSASRSLRRSWRRSCTNAGLFSAS